MSLPGDLVVPVLEALVTRTGAVERLGPASRPFLRFTGADSGQPVGGVRVFTSQQVPLIVYVNVDVPAREVDTHLLYAFTAPDSAVPHFTLDAVATRGLNAFHVDLVPRVDLATHVPYMDAVFGALTGTLDALGHNQAFSPASIPARGRALMSPWMIALRMSEQDWPAVEEPVHAYLDHWLSLAARGLDEETLASVADTDLAARDALLRHNVFGLDIDPSWDVIAGLVGDEPIDELRALFIGR